MHEGHWIGLYFLGLIGLYVLGAIVIGIVVLAAVFALRDSYRKAKERERSKGRKPPLAGEPERSLPKIG